MKRIIIPILVLVLIATIAIVSIPLLVRGDFATAQLSSAVEQATGRKLTLLKPPEVKLWPSLRLEVEGATLSNPPAMFDGTTISAQALKLQLSWSELLSRQINFQELTLVRPRLTLVVDKQGKAAFGFKGPINYVPQLDSAVNKAYRAKFKEMTGREPDEVSINGYDAINMLMLALKKTGGKTDDKVALVKALQTVKYDGPRGPMTIDPKTNNVVQNIYMVEVVEDKGKAAYKVLKTYPNVRDEPNGCKL